MVETEIKETEFKGVNYVHVRTPKNRANGVMAIDDKRIVLTGVPNITITNGSYKFGKEMQFRVIVPKNFRIVEQSRNPSSWNTIEINMPLEVGEELIKKMLEVIKENS